METQTPVDGINMRGVLAAYAAIASVAGLALLGPLPFIPGNGAALGVPYLLFSVARVVGTGLILLGLTALGIAAVGAPLDRRRALGWFVSGHLVVLVMLLLQRQAVWPAGLADWITATWGMATLVLFYTWSTAFGEPFWGRRRRTSLFEDGPGAGVDLERSQLEQQIRLAAAQEERHRLARDLHDSVKQQIFAIQTAAATAEARLDQDAAGVRQAIDAVRASAREAMTEMDAMTDSLRAAPLDSRGLVEALKRQAEALSFRTGADVQVHVGTLPRNEWLPPGSQEAIFRVAQEALANVGRHARATRVTVSLEASAGRILLVVADDGVGFKPHGPTSGDGLANMRARAAEVRGRFEIAPGTAGGTVVRLALPYVERTPQEYVHKISMYGLIVAILATLGALRPSHADWLWWVALSGVVFELLRNVNAWRRTRAILRHAA